MQPNGHQLPRIEEAYLTNQRIAFDEHGSVENAAQYAKFASGKIACISESLNLQFEAYFLPFKQLFSTSVAIGLISNSSRDDTLSRSLFLAIVGVVKLEYISLAAVWKLKA